MEANNVDNKPLVYGGVRVDDDEAAALCLDPKFAVLNNLDDEEFEVEVESSLTKLRWNRMSKTGNCKDKEEREELEKEDAESRQVFDPVDKVFNFQKRRVTDLEQNAYVILPKAQPMEYEAMLELRRQIHQHLQTVCGRELWEEWKTSSKP